MEPANLGKLQRAVLDAVTHADKSEGLVVTMNPHLWRTKEDRLAAYRGQAADQLRPWDKEWAVLKGFLSKHPALGAGDFYLAYHGAKNTNRVKHILLEGLDRKYRRVNCAGPAGILRGSFFGSTIEACKAYGDVVLFVIPKTAWDGKTRGDGAFQAQEQDALPIATYQRPSGYKFSNLFLP